MRLLIYDFDTWLWLEFTLEAEITLTRKELPQEENI